MKSNCIKFILFAFLLCIPFSCEKANLDEDLEQIDEPDDDDGGGTGSGTGGGTGGNTGKKDGRDENDPLTVAEFISGDYDLSVFVKGYIVGACSKRIENADFEAPFEWSSAILLADEKGETDTEKVISIELKSGTPIRKALNLVEHPENYGKQVRIFGMQTTYLGIIGIKNPGSYKLFD